MKKLIILCLALIGNFARADNPITIETRDVVEYIDITSPEGRQNFNLEKLSWLDLLTQKPEVHFDLLRGRYVIKKAQTVINAYDPNNNNEWVGSAVLDQQNCSVGKFDFYEINTFLPDAHILLNLKPLIDEAVKQAQFHQCKRLKWKYRQENREFHKQLGADYFTTDGYAVCDLEK